MSDTISVPREIWEQFENDWFPLVKRAQFRTDVPLSLLARDRLVPGIDRTQAFIDARASEPKKELPAGVRPR